jgi:predicted GH43/DUF377 family glycosyl hydrolase
MKVDRKMVNITKLDYEFLPDSSRVITRYFYPSRHNERALKIIDRVAVLSEERVDELLTENIELFSNRHRDIYKVFKDHYDAAINETGYSGTLSENQMFLTGAYFTMEYSVASAALFNPSMVPHPDQSTADDGEMRFIQSFRAVGEGHISSILFGEGLVKKNGEICIENNSQFLDLGTITHISDTVYELNFSKDIEISSRAIFPVLEDERLGIEDARFVRFENGSSGEDRNITYYATFTAYSGVEIFPKIIETKDFLHFRVTRLKGKDSKNKGMALFPEKINGQYAMIARQDNENLFIMYSDDIYTWENSKLLQIPEQPWEFVQIGNNGSPIRTAYGWLLLTHGVGAVRRYCMGALLLDFDDPSRVIASLKRPFLCPSELERNGYVPNVVYSCGGLEHKGFLIVPYAASDTSSKIAVLSVDELVKNMDKRR